MDTTKRIQRNLNSIDINLRKFHTALIIGDIVNFILVTIAMRVGNLFGPTTFAQFFFFIMTILTFQVFFVYIVYDGLYHKELLALIVFLFLLLYVSIIKIITIFQNFFIKDCNNLAAKFMLSSLGVDCILIILTGWIINIYNGEFIGASNTFVVYPRVMAIKYSRRNILRIYQGSMLLAVQRLSFWFGPVLKWYWLIIRLVNISTMIVFTVYIVFIIHINERYLKNMIKFYIEFVISFELLIIMLLTVGVLDAKVANAQLFLSYSANIFFNSLFYSYVLEENSNDDNDYTENRQYLASNINNQAHLERDDYRRNRSLM